MRYFQTKETHQIIFFLWPTFLNIIKGFLMCCCSSVGEPLGQIHGGKEDSYWKLVHKLSLLLAKLDLKVLSTNNLTISNVLKIALKMVALF